jgi:hypothetical protein
MVVVRSSFVDGRLLFFFFFFTHTHTHPNKTTHAQPLETVESPGNELQSVSSVDSRLQTSSSAGFTHTVLLGPGTCGGGGGSFSQKKRVDGGRVERKEKIIKIKKMGGKKFWGKGSSAGHVISGYSEKMGGASNYFSFEKK